MPQTWLTTVLAVVACCHTLITTSAGGHWQRISPFLHCSHQSEIAQRIEEQSARRRLLPGWARSVATMTRGGATSPRGGGRPPGRREKRERVEQGGLPLGSASGDDTEDLEALLQSVSVDGDALDDLSLDFQDLASLGDFSGLGPLEFLSDSDADWEDSDSGESEQSGANPVNSMASLPADDDSAESAVDGEVYGDGNGPAPHAADSGKLRQVFSGMLSDDQLSREEKENNEVEVEPSHGDDNSKYDSSEYESSEYESSDEEEDVGLLEDEAPVGFPPKSGGEVASAGGLPDAKRVPASAGVPDGESVEGVDETHRKAGLGGSLGFSGVVEEGVRSNEGSEEEEMFQVGMGVDHGVGIGPVLDDDDGGDENGAGTETDVEDDGCANSQSEEDGSSEKSVDLGASGLFASDTGSEGHVRVEAAAVETSEGRGDGGSGSELFDDGEGADDDEEEGDDNDNDFVDDHEGVQDQGTRERGVAEQGVEQVRGGGSDEWATGGETVDAGTPTDGVSEEETGERVSDDSLKPEAGSEEGSSEWIDSEDSDTSPMISAASRGNLRTRVGNFSADMSSSIADEGSEEISEDAFEEPSVDEGETNEEDDDPKADVSSPVEDVSSEVSEEDEPESTQLSTQEKKGRARPMDALPRRASEKQKAKASQFHHRNKKTSFSGRKAHGTDGTTATLGSSAAQPSKEKRKTKRVTFAEESREPSPGLVQGDKEDGVQEPQGVGMQEWLEKQTSDPVPVAAPPRKTLAQLLEEGFPESEEDEEELSRRLKDHRELGRRWVSGMTDSAGFQRTRKQFIKILLLQATANIIRKGAPPGTSPGRERLGLVGVGLAALAGTVHKMLKRRIEDADFDGTVYVETESLSPLAFVLRKKPTLRRMSAREHDLACLRSVARWGVTLFVMGVGLSLALQAGEPLFVCAALALSRYFAEPVFFVHVMGKGGGVKGARRPFQPPSFLNALIGSPHGLAALPTEDSR